MNPKEGYAEAIRRISRWTPGEKLVLSNLSLTHLPPLPASLTYLDCGNNPLIELPEILPSQLETLICMYTQIEKLPELPTTLTEIVIYKTYIKELPMLPSTLEYLMCDCTQIEELPCLPSTLKTLYCDYTMVKELPLLPEGFRSLSCDNTRIKILPNLPKSLISLSVSNTGISSLPPLPETLRCLECNNTRLKLLQPLSPQLHTLKFANSSIVNLPVEFPSSLQYNHLYYTGGLLPEYVYTFETPQEYLTRVHAFQRHVQTIKVALAERESRLRIVKRCKEIKERLMAATWHPDRVIDWCDPHAFDWED